MSPKQKIYHELLRIVLVSLRNAQSLSWWKKARNKPSYYEAELIHNLYVSLFEKDFTDHDVRFLNNQAEWYRENAKGTYNYDYLCKLIEELRSLVPADLQTKLKREK
jgi:hypothetical protein